jgi:hypothetical protein
MTLNFIKGKSTKSQAVTGERSINNNPLKKRGQLQENRHILCTQQHDKIQIQTYKQKSYQHRTNRGGWTQIT